MANGMIVVGDGLTPEEGTICNSLVTDSGSYNCDSPVTGRYVFFWVTFKLPGNHALHLFELRPFGMPNLTQSSSVHENSTDSSDPDFSAQNLVEKSSQRSFHSN